MMLIDIEPILDAAELAGKEYVSIDFLKGFEQVDAVPVVRGEWRQGKEFSTYPRVPFIGTACYCSNCEGEAYWDTDYGQQLFSYCPNCGADMRGSEVKHCNT